MAVFCLKLRGLFCRLKRGKTKDLDLCRHVNRNGRAGSDGGHWPSNADRIETSITSWRVMRASTPVIFIRDINSYFFLSFLQTNQSSACCCGLSSARASLEHQYSWCLSWKFFNLRTVWERDVQRGERENKSLPLIMTADCGPQPAHLKLLSCTRRFH